MAQLEGVDCGLARSAAQRAQRPQYFNAQQPLDLLFDLCRLVLSGCPLYASF